LLQFVNVIKGDMSVVGPRPLVLREAAIHTAVERRLFDAKPGITDISSIVFSDLGDIVASEPDADIAYNQLVRPWKSRLGLLYIDRQSLSLDASIIFLTVTNFFARSWTLNVVAKLLRRLGASTELVAVAERKRKLQPTPPPGSDTVVTHRIPNAAS
jgi:lipopolysaccharide/colanic/teichoic acid biosynthesis glycosyltransferase